LSPPGYWYPASDIPVLPPACPSGSKLNETIKPIKGYNCCQKTDETKPSTKTTTKGTTKAPGNACSDCDWSKFGDTHSMNLKPNPDCKPHKNEVTSEDIAAILAKHNTLRAKVANGDETLGCPGPQPKAANMLEMRWNPQLACVAQAWADQCPDDHDKAADRKICNPDFKYTGQNMYWAWNFEPAAEWDAAIDNWFSEVKDMPETLVPSFGDNTCGNGGVIGHYTQVVWAESYEVGCGAIHHKTTLQGTEYPEAKIYVCNYGPGGNFLGDAVYVEGEPATSCPNGASTAYPGLCNPPA